MVFNVTFKWNYLTLCMLDYHHMENDISLLPFDRTIFEGAIATL